MLGKKNQLFINSELHADLSVQRHRFYFCAITPHKATDIFFMSDVLLHPPAVNKNDVLMSQSADCGVVNGTEDWRRTEAKHPMAKLLNTS